MTLLMCMIIMITRKFLTMLHSDLFTKVFCKLIFIGFLFYFYFSSPVKIRIKILKKE